MQCKLDFFILIKRFYASQITLMFEYLHNKNIIYRDLKPENLLIDKLGYLMLTDFGFAKEVTSRTYTLCGTPEYLAPEILLQKGHGKAVDWWCLGIIIYEMLVGIDPFNDDDPMRIYQNILETKIRFPSCFNKNAKSLVRHLLVKDLAKRYGNLKNGVKDIKEHRWFKEVNWEDTLKKNVKPPYFPKIKNDGDISNFNVDYPQSDDSVVEISKSKDPFINW